MPRPSNTDQRRKEISAALIRVMSSRGYHGASIARIAREAGLTPGLVHYHFDSKAEILLAAVRELVRRFQRRYQQRTPAEADPEAELDAFIDAHLALGEDADQDAVAAWVVIASQAVQNEEVQRVYSESVAERLAELERLIKALRRARGDGGRGSKHTAAAILAAIEGSFLLASAAPGTLPRGYAAPALRAMARALLGGGE